jgi:hypothetical protein
MKYIAFFTLLSSQKLSYNRSIYIHRNPNFKPDHDHPEPTL